MPIFILQTRLAPDAIRSPRMLERLEREVMDRIRGTCPGVKWVASWAVLGPTDYLDVFEAPDVESATRVAALVRTFGHATTEVWVALPWERFKETVRELPGRPEWIELSAKP